MHTHDPAPLVAFLAFAVLAVCAVLFLGSVIGTALGRLG